MLQVHLNNKVGIEWVALREITGVDELSVSGSSTVEAIQLLDALLVQSGPGSMESSGVAVLSAWDREQILASTYVQVYGEKIENVIQCSSCGENFDLDFSLHDLIASLVPNNENDDIEKIDSEVYQTQEGVQFRLPTGFDEYEVMGLPAPKAEEELFRRCVLNHASIDNEDMDEEQKEKIQAAIEAASPIVYVELDAVCPECLHAQAVHFDLQYYFLTALNKERTKLMHEVHALALNYGWGLTEILELPRSQRRTLVQLIEASESAIP